MLRPVATIELIYVDASGNTSAVVVNVPVSSSIATMDAQATALASLIAPMTDAVLIKARYSFKASFVVDITEAGSTPIVVCGMFFLNTTDHNPLEVITVPAFKPSLLVHIGPTSEYGIDTTLDEVTAFIDELIAYNACNPFGDVIVSIKSAFLERRV